MTTAFSTCATTTQSRGVSEPAWIRRRRRRRVIFAVLAAFYAVLTLAVIFRSPMITLDRNIRALDLSGHWPAPYPYLNTYVMLGQRAPSTLCALPYLCWKSWRARSWRPLVTLTCALLMLNLSVGIVKIGLGRIGPHHDPHAHAIFDGGDIYPSGHTSNAVVLFGVLAYLAVRQRKIAVGICVLISGTVGLSTIYLDTHWLSDVLGGWLAGSLVLLALPAVLSRVETLAARARRRRARNAGRELTTSPETRKNRHLHRVQGARHVAGWTQTNTHLDLKGRHPGDPISGSGPMLSLSSKHDLLRRHATRIRL